MFVAMRKFFFFFKLKCMNFLSRKIHLKLLQCSLDQENDYSNFKKKFGKVLCLEDLLECEQWCFFSKK